MFNRERRWQKIDNRTIIISVLLIIIPFLYGYIYKKKKERELEKVFVDESIIDFVNNRNNAAPFMINDSISFDSANYIVIDNKHTILYHYSISNKKDKGFDKIKMCSFSFYRIQNDNTLARLLGFRKNMLLKFIYNNNSGEEIGSIAIDSELYKYYNPLKQKTINGTT